MNIKLNEKAIFIDDGLTLGAVAGQHKQDADVLILNGFPSGSDTKLKEGVSSLSPSVMVATGSSTWAVTKNFY